MNNVTRSAELGSNEVEDLEPLEDGEALREIVMKLVRHPAAVKIDERNERDTTFFTIHVHLEDLGSVIGKNGETISLIRKLFGRIAAKQGRKANIHLHEPNRLAAV
jgi:predicted RNA-binding protein YlqC (UPF0109 family)